MRCCQLMVNGVTNFLVFSSFRFKLLSLAFSLTVASRLFHPYWTNDKTSRLTEKRFSTVRDIQRGSQNNIKKRRGKREIEVTRRKKGGIKRGESTIASNQFPMCFPQPGTLTEVHRIM